MSCCHPGTPKFPPNPHIGAIYVKITSCCKHMWQWDDHGHWRYKGQTKEVGHRCESRPLDFGNLPQKDMTAQDLIPFYDPDTGCYHVANRIVDAGTYLFWYDAQPIPEIGGNVGEYVWEPDTVPPELHLISAVSDQATIKLFFYAEGDPETLTPTVTVNGEVIPLEQSDLQVGGSINPYRYQGEYIANVSAPFTVFTATSDTGGYDSVTIYVAPPGPLITGITFGPYPGTQTELKENDQIEVTVICENSAVACEILDEDASQYTSLVMLAEDSAGPGYREAVGWIDISDETGWLPVHAIATNDFGTSGERFTSEDLLLLNQTYPTIVLNSVTYPGSQEALGIGDSAYVDVTVTDQDVTAYASSYLTIPNPTTYEQVKAVEHLTGTYIGPDELHYEVTATRTANDATTIDTFAVAIATVEPVATITIDGDPLSLTSGVPPDSGVDYTVRVTFSQELLSFNSMDASGGEWQGTWVQAGPKVWVRQLRVYHDTQRGEHHFGPLDVTGLSGINDGSIPILSGETYLIGGFDLVTVYMPPFSRIVELPIVVADAERVVASYGEAIYNLELRGPGTAIAGGTKGPSNKSGEEFSYWFDGFSITDSEGIYQRYNGTHLTLTDDNIVASNSQGWLSVDVLEPVS